MCTNDPYVITELLNSNFQMSTNQAFENWMNQINNNLVTQYEVRISDLPDEPFWDFFEDGLEPQEVVKIMIENASVF